MAVGGADQNEMLARLRAKYIAELPGKIDEIEDSLMALAPGAAGDEAMLELYRRVHSIKGSAGSYGVPIVGAICHRLEDGINAAQDEGMDSLKAFVDSSLPFVDLLREAVALLRAGGDDASPIEAKLDALTWPHAEAKDAEGRRISVMLLDDARTTSILLRSAFKNEAIDLVVASNDLAALERLMDERFDVLVCGRGAGRMGGLGVIAALKLSQGRSRDAISVLLTADPGAVPATRPGPDVVMGRGPGIADDLKAMIGQMRLGALP